MISQINRFLTSPLDKTPRSRVIFWFSLSMIFAIIYAGLALTQAFEKYPLIHDDARVHTFWMQRFIDPELFPNDLIADYFQSVAPAGYLAVYKLGIFLGIEPLVFSRILPAIIGIISTPYFFGICLEILPVPFCGFVGALLMNQTIWLKDDVASGTPRAFLYPIFCAFLYYLLRNSTVGIVITITLIGLFYPQYVFIASGILILRLFCGKNRHFRGSRDKINRQMVWWGLSAAFCVLLPYAMKTSEFGPTITKAQALQSLEFFPNGRNLFFHADPLDYWFFGRRSGMFSRSLFTPATQCLALLSPLLLVFRSRFPLVQQIKSGIWVLFQLLLSAIGMFFLAHAVLFKLHLPARYTGVSFRLILTILTAITITLIIDALLNWLEVKDNRLSILKPVISWGLISVIVISLLFYPSFVSRFPLVKYQQGRHPELYTFFQQQPKDILIASVSGEINQLPTYAKRSILIGREYTVPYHVGYYRQIEQRTFDLLQAHYSPNLEDVKALIQKYGVDLFLIELYAFVPEYFPGNDWMLEFEQGQEAYKLTQEGETSALAKTISKCTVFEQDTWFVVDADCILKL